MYHVQWIKTAVIWMFHPLSQQHTFSDVASLPKHYPHHDKSTWFCPLLSKEESVMLLRGRVDETFLVRATELSRPNHVYTVDVVWVAVRTIHVTHTHIVGVHLCDSACVFMCVCWLYTYRVQREVVSLCVYKEGDWLQLDRSYRRHDSINTLVMYYVTAAYPIPVGDHELLTNLRYPVHSSQYYI